MNKIELYRASKLKAEDVRHIECIYLTIEVHDNKDAYILIFNNVWNDAPYDVSRCLSDLDIVDHVLNEVVGETGDHDNTYAAFERLS